MIAPRYRFLPWVRLGASPPDPDLPDADLAPRATLPLTLRINDRHDVAVTARLHGPGDVVSIDTRQVVRTDPPHLASEFEPNYFPLVEFDRPDLPWLFTPATGDAAGKLRPWIVLVTVRRQPGVSITVDPASRRPVLRIAAPARPGAELPDLADSWAWAHAQVLDAGTGIPLADQLAASSTQNLSRLLCARRLASDTAYVACVVPAFEIGRRAGLGLPTRQRDEEHLDPAWGSDDDAPNEIDLPVLYHWEFSTGAAGDFEALARRLTPRPAPSGSPGRPLSARGLGFGLPDLGTIELGGALRPIGGPGRGPLPSTFATALRTLLDLPVARLTGGSTDPVVGPPIYGSRQAARTTVTGAPPWLASLNLDPRLRAFAGLGVAVVQEQQEHLMAAAWEQLGPAASAARQLHQPAFAGAVLRRIHRHLATLDPDRLAAVTAPAMARLLVTPPVAVLTPGGSATVTMQRALADSRTPSTVLSAAFRRAVRPRGPLLRRAALAAGGVPARPATKFVTQLATSPSVVFFRLPRPDMVTTLIIGQQLDRLPVPSVPGPAAQHKALPRRRQRAAHLRGPPHRSAPAQRRPQPVRQYDDATPPPGRPRPGPHRPAGPAVVEGGAASGSPPPDRLPTPYFPQPMYEVLRDLDPQFLLPGCDRVEPDSVIPLATDPGVVEAFMVGLNHEMARELLWREYPGDDRGTPFLVFWPRSGPVAGENTGQMPQLHKWEPNSQLGTHLSIGAGSELVVLVRGELFARYPGTIVYLTRSTTPGTAGSERVLPAFRAPLTPDMTFFGFAVPAAQLAAATLVRGLRATGHRAPLRPRRVHFDRPRRPHDRLVGGPVVGRSGRRRRRAGRHHPRTSSAVAWPADGSARSAGRPTADTWPRSRCSSRSASPAR